MQVQHLVEDLAALTGAAVTLEDSEGYIIAYSPHPTGLSSLDEPRVRTILGRRVPGGVLSFLRDLGVYRRIAHEPGPVKVGPHPEVGLGERLAIAVRWGGDVVGYLWLLTPDDSVVSSYCQEICRSAEEIGVALGTEMLAGTLSVRNLLRLMADTTDENAKRVFSAAIRRLRGGLSAPFCVLVVRPRTEGEREGLGFSRLTLFRVCERALTQLNVEHLVGFIDDDLVAICGGRKLVGGTGLEQLGRELAAEMVKVGAVCDVGIGRKAMMSSDIIRSYREALQALDLGDVLEPGDAPRILLHDRTGIYGLVRCLVDCPKAGNFGRDIAETIAEYDRAHGSYLLPTLCKYLERRGDRKRVAAELFVHPNTLDYRLRRIQQISGLDLDNPDQCLAVLVWIKALHPILCWHDKPHQHTLRSTTR